MTNQFEYMKEKSKCKLNEKELNSLTKIFENEKVTLDLLYRGSEHGWLHQNFH